MLLMESRTILTLLFVDFLALYILLNILFIMPFNGWTKPRKIITGISALLLLIFGGFLTYFTISPLAL
ncbi:hypothetical protein CIB95_07575 [Lottiidibacillus patelloidae]|uniref:Uncharacterized protein n=1 Tax=Lottiidibacillus patelloidae TaxID=2670334 RepID=A0A263BVX2_9BACI|nr:hypothetical protein [Lottiidibacillus patelloidae]OZM57316.1 hypothetical protein CIB95_07575 [Lottiidibacillus patelloidae]